MVQSSKIFFFPFQTCRTVNGPSHSGPARSLALAFAFARSRGGLVINDSKYKLPQLQQKP